MIGPFWIDDVPSQPVAVEVYRDEEEGELSVFTGATATLLKPTGGVQTLTATLSGDNLIVPWPTSTPFPVEGVYSLILTLTGVEFREALAPIEFVVQADDGYHTVTSARAEWSDGVQLSDVQLYNLLSISRDQVEAYAPDEERAGVPRSFRQAQLLQARSLWNVSKSETGSAIGNDAGFVITIRPLDSTVRQLIRPISGIPVIV
jgi:hypothetical protein